MRQRRKNSSKGLAMIMVLVMVVIFAALILAVVISSSTAIRRAHFYRDKTTALQIASAGVQDALYWMNYTGYQTQYYPCTDTSTGAYDATLQYFHGSAASPAWTAAEPANYNPANISRARCVVQFTDNDETDTANLDIMTSTGYYNGRTAKISVRIRGQNGLGNTFHADSWRVLRDMGYDTATTSWSNGTATWGIPEDFNKHTVFAHLLTTSNPATTTVTGNLTTEDFASSTFPTIGNEWTKTIAPYPINEDSVVRVESSIYIQATPPASIVSATYIDTGYAPLPYNLDPDGAGPAPEATIYAANCFEFIGGDTVLVPIEIRGNARFQDMGIQHYVRVSPDGGLAGDVIIQGNTAITGFLDASGSVTLLQNASVLDGAGVCVKGNGISFASPNLYIENGLFYSTGALTVNVNNLVPFIGTFLAEGTSTFGSGCKIGTAAEPARIVTVGAMAFVQLRGMTLHGTVYSQGQIWIGIASNTITADANTGVALILDRAAVGGSGSTIVSDTTHHTIIGLIYARGVGSTIILNNDNVTGAVVADGTVQYTGTIVHNFGTQSYTNNPQVYGSFKGGRRRYLPVPGSWEVTW